MKQPRSSSQANAKLAKKPLLPSFRQSKISNKVQQLSASNKSQLYFNNKLIPLQVLAERKVGEGQKIIVNSADIVIFEGGKITKTSIVISSSIDKNIGKDWIQLNLGETFHQIRIKKIGDQNAFGTNGQMFSWDKPQNVDKKLAASINVREIMKNQHHKLEHSMQLHQNQGNLKQDKNKQMKAFVANIMSKKLGRRSTQRCEGQTRFSSRKDSQILKSKPFLGDNELKGESGLWNVNPPSTAASILSGVSGPRSFRKDILSRNKLKDSKFTGKSQKQTSVGDQSVFLNKANQNTTNMSSVQHEDEYTKRKLKFDSQPYFYQNSTITSQFSNKNESVQKFHSLTRQESYRKQSNGYSQKLPQHSTEVVQCFQNKSEHQSEQEVEQDIKRSAMMQSSIVKNQDQQDVPKQKEGAQQSSQCFQSKQLQSKAESSGTIYQSKYQ